MTHNVSSRTLNLLYLYIQETKDVEKAILGDNPPGDKPLSKIAHGVHELREGYLRG